MAHYHCKLKEAAFTTTARPRMMAEPNPSLSAVPAFSVVIPTYNDWASLELCLHSLELQKNAPTFEVVVVDDGSSSSVPELIAQWASRFPLRLIRAPHAGIAVSRNRGIEVSNGNIILSVDADCILAEDCLAELASAMEQSPQDHYFQLRLLGDCCGVVGRAEELRLRALQHVLLQPDGRIRYLNTAGFAIRREATQTRRALFDPLALRAEDTLLLSHLIRNGKLPLFVARATVTHAVRLSVIECLLKDFRSAPQEARAYRMIARSGIAIRMTNRKRWAILRFMWRASADPSIGRLTWFVLVARQTLQRGLSSVCEFFGPRAQTS